jgi:hypothetical protein
LHEALDLIVEDRAGPLTGTLVARDLDSTDGQDWWELAEPSAFHDDDGGAYRRLRKIRCLSNYTLDDLADELGVSATDVALWGSGRCDH